MKKYICAICGYVYDETLGDDENGVAKGTNWENVPEDWTCPLCGTAKSDFDEQKPSSMISTEPINDFEEKLIVTNGELSSNELSAIFSNLAKGAQKQYRTNEADLFSELSEYYDNIAVPVKGAQLSDLKEHIEKDLNSSYQKANKAANGDSDRGALRALAWGEKVSKIVNSLLVRYDKQNNLIKDKEVYVCEICGFIYLGESLPDVCPVCKVPNFKMSRV